ncbi:MAG: AsmA family protein [Nitrospinaceae bacterium]
MPNREEPKSDFTDPVLKEFDAQDIFQEALTEEPAEDPPPPRPPGKSWGKKILVFLSLTMLGLVLLLVGVGLALKYYFPWNNFRPIAERELTRILHLPVSIESVELDLLRGLRVSRVSLGGEPALFRVGEVILDYDLTRLLQGHLIINKVIVDRPEITLTSVGGVWNFQPLLEKPETPPPPEPEPPKKEPSSLPPLPVAVNLQRLAVNNIRLNLDMDGKVVSRIEGLNLEAGGKIDRTGAGAWLRVTMAPSKNGFAANLVFSSREDAGIDVKTLALTDLKFTTADLNRIHLAGTFGLQNSEIRVGEMLPVPELSGEVNMDVDLKEQMLTLGRLLVTLAGENHLDISGKAGKLFTGPTFELQLNQATFDLKDLVEWAGKKIPPVEVRGTVNISGLEVAGSLPDFKPESLEIHKGRVEIKNLYAGYPGLDAALDGMDAEVNLQNVRLAQGVPQAVDAGIRLKLDRGRWKDIVLTGLDQELRVSGKGPNLPEITLTFSTAFQEIAYTLPQTGRVKVPLNVKGAMAANLESGNIGYFNVDYRFGPLVTGQLKARAQDFGKKSFKITQDVEVQLDRLRALIPQTLLAKLDGLPSQGRTTVHSVIQGKLDSNFQPLGVSADTRIEVKDLRAELKNPPVRVQKGSVLVSFPMSYNPQRGVKIPELKIDTRFQKVSAPGRGEAGPVRLQTRLTLDEYFDPAHPGRTLPVTNRTTLRLDRPRLLQPDLHASSLVVKTSLNADLSGDTVRNLKLTGEVSLEDAEALKEIKTGRIQSTFGVDLDDLSLTRTRTEVKIQVAAPSPGQVAGRIPVGPLTFDALTRQNLKTGDIEIEHAKFQAPSLLDFQARGTVGRWGKTFDLETKVSGAKLAALWKKVPATLREGMEDLDIAGTAGLSLKVKGTRPEKFELKKSALPVVLTLDLGLTDASLSWPGRGMTIEKMNSAAQVRFQDGSGEVSGKLGAGKLFLKEWLGTDWLDPEFNFHYILRDFNRLTVKEHRFSIKHRGVTHTLSGRLDGLKPFLTGKAPIRADELVRRVDLLLSTENELRVGKALAGQSVPLVKGIQAEGAIRSRLTLKLRPGKRIELDGDVGFRQFSLQMPESVKVIHVNGKFPFNKKLWLDRKLLKPGKRSFSVSQKGFFNRLRDFSRYKNILRVEAVELPGIRVSNLGLDIFFKNNQLMVEKFLFDVLDGSVAGNLFVAQGPEGPELKFSTEFAGLNFGSLVGRSATAEAEESEIDGNMQMGFQVKKGRESEPISIDQIFMKVAVTRIGAETLDRALLFLDPEESKPAIVDTRAKLKLASPHRLLVTLENGNLNVEAWLKNKVLGDILKAPELKRVPVTGLKQFQALSDQLQSLSGLRDALNYLSAEGIEFDPEGGWTLF